MSEQHRLYWITFFEKFTVNGFRSILLLYAIHQLGMPESQAFEWLGATLGTGLLLPLIGGLLAKWLGSIRTIILLGLSLMLLATLLICLLQGTSWPCFTWCLAVLVIGSGLVRSNVPALLGQCQQVAGTDSFTQLYIYINGGSLLGILCCGAVSEIYGWQIGFVFPVIASTTALILARKLTAQLPHKSATNPTQLLKAILCLPLAIVLVYAALSQVTIYAALTILLLIAALRYLFGLVYRAQTLSPYNCYQLLVFASVHLVFLALYEQGSLSLTLFIDKHVERQWPAWLPALNLTTLTEIPVSSFQLIDPLLNIVLGSILLVVWRYLKQRHQIVSLTHKFLLGLGLTAGAFLMLALASHELAKLSYGCIILIYALLVLAELCVIPTGLAFINSIAPAGQQPLFMGFWYLGMGCAQWLALSLAKMTVAPAQSDSCLAISHYQHSFWLFGYLALATMAVLLVIKLVEHVRSKKSS